MTNPVIEYYINQTEEVPEGQALSDYLPRTIASEIPFTPDIITIQLPMNDERFLKLCSSIANGAFWTYPDEWLEVVGWFWQAMEVAMTCEDVADCIDNDEGVQNALINQIDTNLAMQEALRRQVSEALLQMGFDPDATTVPSSVASGEIKDLANCDKDALWAGIRDGIVQRLDDNARTFYEIMVTKVDLIERGTAVIGAIPIVGGLGEALAEQFTEVIPDLLNAYDSYSSIEALDTAACEIFALVCNLCRYPTLQELYDYFASFGAVDIQDLATLTATVAYEAMVGAATGAGFFVWHTTIAVQLYTLLLNEKFGNLLGVDSIATMASLGEDFANDNWEVLCDACVAQYSIWEWDFSNGQGDWIPTQISGVPQGVFEGGTADGIVSGSTKSLQIELPLDPTWRIIGARVEYEITNQTQTIMRYRQYMGTNTNAVNPSISNCTDAGTGYRWSWQGSDIDPPDAPVTGKRSFWLVLTSSTNTSTIKVHKVSFEFEYDHSAQPSFATEDPDYLWCP